MRIMLMVPECCPIEDQTATAVLRGLSRAYERRGHVALVADLVNPPQRQRSVSKAQAWGRIHCLGASPASSFQRLRAFLETESVDFAHLHTSGALGDLAFACGRVLESRQVPFGITFQGVGGSAPSATGCLRSRQARRMLACARWVSGVSRFAAEEIARRCPVLGGRIEIVANGYDPDERDASVIAQGVPGGSEPFVLCAARLTPQKGIDVLLMAWRDVCDRTEGVHLVICGADACAGQFQELSRRLGVSRRVRFLGRVGRDRLWALMRASLLFVLPSRGEAFGIAALEAMACGKAVLATRAGGLPEFIRDGRTGMLVPAADIGALRDGLLALMRDQALRESLGAGACKAAARYRWDDAAAAYLRLTRLALLADA